MRDVLQTPVAARAYGRRPGATGTMVVVDGDIHVWPNALPAHKSPCRIDSSKGLRQHRCSPAHRDAVQGYRSWARAAQDAAEAATHGYETELAEYWVSRERPTFKAYLLGMAAESDAA